MRVLHAYNLHRGFGGSDAATRATVSVLRAGGMAVEEFVRDSAALPSGLAGRVAAFAGGLYAAGAVREFEAVLARWRPDVVHAHELYPLISPWILPACTRAGVPVVMNCSDFRLSCPIATHHVRGEACHRCLGGREYWCLLRDCRDNLAESAAYAVRNASARAFGLFERHVRRFVAVSEYQRDFLTGKVGIAPARVALNPCAIALPPEPVADPSRGGYAAFAGRFAPEKGVEVMVEACRRAGVPMRFASRASSHPAVRAGDDASFDLASTPEELAAFYRGARLVVVPSLWPETFGLVAAEAMSHGIPVVASRLGALEGTVRDGQSGLLARPGDAGDFAEKIARVWRDPGLARALGRGARERVATQYSHRAHFDRLASLYAEVAGEARARP